MQFATNDLGHVALALGLQDAPAAAADARIVSLSSVGHRRSPVIFDDINFSSRPYDPGGAYGQSKTPRAVRRRGDTPLEWRRHLRQRGPPADDRDY